MRASIHVIPAAAIRAEPQLGRAGGRAIATAASQTAERVGVDLVLVAVARGEGAGCSPSTCKPAALRVAARHDRGSVMSMRGPDRNAERNRGGHIGPDGLRARERELLKVARAGEPLAAQQGVTLLERLAKLRYGLARTRAEHVAASPSAALIEAYDELCSAFVLLLHERDDVDAHMAHARAEADQRMDAA